jgi:Leucine-rich repeat (LRR) protein
MSWWGLLVCKTTFKGLDGLQQLVLTGNLCLEISERMFDFLPSLRQLHFAHMTLRPGEFAAVARRLFKKLNMLQKLDLSHNGLVEIDPSIFRTLDNLAALNVSFNHLSSLPVRTDLHEELQVIDLSANNITSLSIHETHALQLLASSHRLWAYMDRNPITCDCSNAEFLRWLLREVRNNVNITVTQNEHRDVTSLDCVQRYGVKSNLSEYSQTDDYKQCDLLRPIDVSIQDRPHQPRRKENPLVPPLVWSLLFGFLLGSCCLRQKKTNSVVECKPDGNTRQSDLQTNGTHDQFQQVI